MSRLKQNYLHRMEYRLREHFVFTGKTMLYLNILVWLAAPFLLVLIFIYVVLHIRSTAWTRKYDCDYVNVHRIRNLSFIMKQVYPFQLTAYKPHISLTVWHPLVGNSS